MASSPVAQPSQAGPLAPDGTAAGFVSLLVEAAHRSQYSRPALAVGGTLFALLLAIHLFLTPHVGPREPPVLKPAVPVIGHLIGLLTKNQLFFQELYQKKPTPIATLPMLNGKVYAVFSPVLATAALRVRTLSFEPFVIDAAAGVVGLDKKGAALVRAEGLVPAFLHAIHLGLTPEHLHPMNARALSHVASTLNAVGRGDAAQRLEIPNLYLWLRDLISKATCEALYGAPNPFRGKPGLMQDLWDFEKDTVFLVPNILPALMAPRAHRARARLQAVLMDHYAARLDQDPSAAEITRQRASALRRYGVSGRDAGKIEVTLLHASTTNSAPAAFWLVAHIVSRPELQARLRAELEPFVQLSRRGAGEGGGRTATVGIAQFEERCPLLVSAYREMLRTGSQVLAVRRVMEDTALRDGDGRDYLLKKGCDVQMPAAVPHTMPEAWGPDAAEFRADRFLASCSPGPEGEKLRRSAFFPFGGGKNLCPGRNFAFAEVLGLACALTVGFEIEAAGGGGPMPTPRFTPARLTDGVMKPDMRGEGGVTIRRRQGWEDVVWTYAC